MSENDVIANQKQILEHQQTILANQKIIQDNQAIIKQNQESLPLILKNQEKILALLAEDYLINPGLHMTRGDIAEHLTDDDSLDGLLVALEQKGLVKIYRTKKGIELIKATYDGLKKANPKEYYRWFPAWVSDDRKF